MLRSFLVAGAVVAGLVLAAPEARAVDGFTDTVDLETAAIARVRGTLRPAVERESFLLDLPMGAVVRAAAKRRGRNTLVPAADLALDDAVVATATTRGRGSSLRSPELAESGAYRVRVFGDLLADGDYQLKFTTTFRKRWTGTGGAVPGISQFEFRFGAPAGALAQIRLSPARGSGFVPALDQLVGPEGFELLLSGARTSFLPLGPAGTYSVRFRNGGTEEGDWVVNVSLRLPRAARSTVDISAGALTGAFDDDQQVFGRQVGAEGGLVDPPDLGGALDGSSVTIPPGALPFPIVITISPSPPFEIGDGTYGAGPTISFGPPGTEFEEGLPAILAIPYDPSLYLDPASDLTVYVQDPETGVVSPVLPREEYDFSQPGIVSFPTPHFSAYVAARNGPRPLAGSWVALTVESSPEFDFGGRSDVTCGDLDFDGDAFWSVSLSGSEDRWYRSFDDEQGGGPRPRAFRIPLSEFDYGSVAVAGPTNVSLYSYMDEQSTQFRRAPGGDVLVHDPVTTDRNAQTIVALRRPPGNPTRTTLAGRYHGFFYANGAEDGDLGSGSPPELYLDAGRFTATFGLDGSVVVSNVSARRHGSAFPEGTWSTAPSEIPSRWTAFPAGRDVIVYLGDVDLPPIGQDLPPLPDVPLPPALRFRPCLGGDVLVSAADSFDLDVMLVVLVREGSNLGPAHLAGPAFGFGVSQETRDRNDPSAQGSRAESFTTVATLTPPKRLDVAHVGSLFLDHDAQGSPSPFLEISEPPFQTETGTYSLAPNGAYRDSTGFQGAASRGGDLIVGAVSDSAGVRLYFSVPGLELLFD